MTDTLLKEMQCGRCGVWHAIPQKMYDTCLEEGGFWHCPNGHSWGFREGQRKKEEVRRERDLLKQQLAQRDDEIARQRRLREDTERALSAQKGQVTKLRKRASAGVCPCCNRTVSQMARHMASKHPGFKAEEVA